jgi:hypothetical protein
MRPRAFSYLICFRVAALAIGGMRDGELKALRPGVLLRKGDRRPDVVHLNYLLLHKASAFGRLTACLAELVQGAETK